MKLLTTISVDYVSDWSFFEGVRELNQNGLDAQDKGFRFDIIYLRNKNELLIYNENTYLTRSNLLLGNTSKRGDETQRGQFGEGFKIGVLALIRAGYPVIITNGINNEIITSSIEKHPDYGNVEVLCFHTQMNDILPIDKNKLIFTIQNVHPEDINKIKNKFLHWEGLELGDYYKTKGGKVLIPERYKGKIFSRGIWVCDDDKFEYGYDFDNLKLGRDRNLASHFDICWETGKIWGELGAKYGKDDLVIKMLESDAADVRDISYFNNDKLKHYSYDKFFSVNGEKSYPCSNEYQKKEVASLGLKPVFVSETYRKVLEPSIPSIFSLKEKQKLAKVDKVDMTKVFSDLIAKGWKIKYYECDCGGKYVWLKPMGAEFVPHGCICHDTPINNQDQEENDENTIIQF